MDQTLSKPSSAHVIPNTSCYLFRYLRQGHLFLVQLNSNFTSEPPPSTPSLNGRGKESASWVKAKWCSFWEQGSRTGSQTLSTIVWFPLVLSFVYFLGCRSLRNFGRITCKSPSLGLHKNKLGAGFNAHPYLGEDWKSAWRTGIPQIYLSTTCSPLPLICCWL